MGSVATMPGRGIALATVAHATAGVCALRPPGDVLARGAGPPRLRHPEATPARALVGRFGPTSDQPATAEQRPRTSLNTDLSRSSARAHAHAHLAAVASPADLGGGVRLLRAFTRTQRWWSEPPLWPRNVTPHTLDATASSISELLTRIRDLNSALCVSLEALAARAVSSTKCM